jgi:hypothetical protein
VPRCGGSGRSPHGTGSPKVELPHPGRPTSDHKGRARGVKLVNETPKLFALAAAVGLLAGINTSLTGWIGKRTTAAKEKAMSITQGFSGSRAATATLAAHAAEVAALG